MKLSLRSLLLPALATLATFGCAASPAENNDAEEGTSDLIEGANLTPEQRDERRIAAIRNAVKDVEQEHVTISSRVKAPSKSPPGASASWPGTDSLAGGSTSLYGVDWFQKWPGGKNADHGWDNGTPYGQRCMWAASLRFEAIMQDAPAEMKEFLASYSAWRGNFYNWVDDYSGKSESGEAAYGDASGARLWAWRTGLSKWISQTAKDGSCYLPTRKMVAAYATECRSYAAAHGGEMQNCQARQPAP